MTPHTDAPVPGRAPAADGLYDPRHEHDACGVGFVANISGKKEFRILDYAIRTSRSFGTI